MTTMPNATLPGAPRTSKAAYAATAALVVVLAVLPFFAGQWGNSWVRILDFALLYIMLALGLNIVVGFAGQLDEG